jgi:hypothetical protein
MPSRPPPDEELNGFGRWFYQICDELGVTIKEVAVRAGRTEGAMSKNTKVSSLSGDKMIRGPDYETVVRIWQAMREIASEKGIPWDEGDLKYFYHSAFVATDEEAQEAESHYQERKLAKPQRRRRRPGKTPQDLASDRGISPNNRSSGESH